MRAFIKSIFIFLIFISFAKAEPIEEGSFAGATNSVTIVGNYAYIGQGTNFRIIDISNKASPSLVGTLDVLSTIQSITISGNYAYVSYSTGVKKVAINNPANPTLSLTYTNAQSVRDSAIYGNYLYILEGTTLKALDTATMTAVGNTLSTTQTGFDIEINGTTAYIASGTAGVQKVTGIDSPTTLIPAQMTTQVLGTQINSLEIANGKIYATGENGNFFILNSTTLATITNTNTGALALKDIKIQNSIAYVANNDNRVSVYDVSNDALNFVSYNTITLGVFPKIDLSNSYLYTAGSGSTKFSLLNVSNVSPQMPSWTADPVVVGAGPYDVTLSFEISPSSTSSITNFIIVDNTTGTTYDYVGLGNVVGAANTITLTGLAQGNHTFSIKSVNTRSVTTYESPINSLSIAVNEPQLTVSTNSIDFGADIQNNTENITLTIRNNGSANLIMSNPAFVKAGADAGQFNIVSGCDGSTLAYNATCTITITYLRANPATKTDTANLTINSANDGSSVVNLTGQVTPAPVATIAMVDPLVQTVSMSSTLNTPITSVVKIKNSGTANLNFTSFNISGANADKFSIASNGCSSPLIGNAECNMTISYNANAIGVHVGSIDIVSNATNNPFSITLNGTTTAAPTATLSIDQVSPLSFGIQSIGVSTDKIFTVSNTGTATLTGLNITLTTGTLYNIVNNGCGANLNPSGQAGDSCQFTVRYLRNAGNGTHTDTVNISSTNATNSPQSVNITGITGTNPEASIAPTPHDFGENTQNTTSMQSFTVSNIGNAQLDITAISLALNSSAQYSITGGDCAVGTPVPAGGSCTIEVTFLRNIAGTNPATSYLGTLRVVSNSGGVAGTNSDVSLTGKIGLGAIIRIGANNQTVNFTAIERTQTATQSVTIYNIGTQPLSITGLNSTNPNFSITGGTCGAVPISIPANSNCSLTLQFIAPNGIGSVGTKTGSFTVTSNSTTSRDINVSAEVKDTLSVSVTNGGQLSFGTVKAPNGDEVGETRVQTVTVRNTGLVSFAGLPLTITEIPDSPHFSIANNNCSGAELGAGATCTFEIVFAPQSLGTFTNSGTINISYNPTWSFSLSGTGGVATLPLGGGANGTGTVVTNVPISDFAKVLLFLSILYIGLYYSRELKRD